MTSSAKVINLSPKPSHKLCDLIDRSEAISPDTRVSVLAERFYSEPALDCLPLVKDGYPWGLATRNKILTTLAIRFGYALFGKRPIRVIADMHPLVVSHTETLEDVLSRAMARDFQDIYDEILVTDDTDKYLGKLSVKKLVIEQSTQLAQSIALRELALVKTAEMKKINEMKSNFMAHITHELRSPVHAIVGLSELMENRYAKQQLEDFPKFLSLLATSSVNLRAIINNILDLSKIEAGRMEVLVEEFDLEALLNEVLDTCKVLIGEKPIAIELESVADRRQHFADKVKIRQILLNLASNAIKYTDRGIVVIGADIDINNQLHLSVRDTGIGIRQEDLGRLFKSFSQLEDAKSRRHSGSGLGLSITRQMVELLDGRIEVDSTFGVGSRFDVYLPMANEDRKDKAQ